MSYLTRKYQGKLIKQDLVEKEDLDLVRRLSDSSNESAIYSYTD